MHLDWQQLFDEVKARSELGSDAQLADHLGITRAQISAWRNGKSDLGTLTKLKLLDALGHDSLHSAMLSLLPTRNRDESIRLHTSLLDRVGRRASLPGATGINGHAGIGADASQVLATLPSRELARLRPHLARVSMVSGAVVYEPGDMLHDVYLPTTAVIAMLHVMDSGASAEIALIGRDGLLGIALLMGGQTMPGRAVVQCAGEAYRLNGEVARAEFTRGGALQQCCLRYTQALMMQMAQTAACQRHHPLLQQFCRWLLLSLDRVRSNHVHINRDLLAIMLGVSQAEVTAVLKQLRERGLIRYDRGVIEVLDRPVLEAAACECYAAIGREWLKLLGNP